MIPEDIEGPDSKLIFLYLKTQDEVKDANEISDNLNISMLAVLPITKRLCKSGYLEREDGMKFEICEDVKNKIEERKR